MDAHAISEIELDCGPCFGTCPVFRFTVSRHSGYTYVGRLHVEPLGSRAGGFPGSLFDRLAEICVELRVLELDDEYTSDFDDAPSTLVTVRHNGGTKVIRSDLGDVGPVRLWAFTNLVEVTMRQVFEIEDRKPQPRRKKR